MCGLCWYQVCVIFPTSSPILWCQLSVNSIPTLSTWSEHQIPQVKGSVPQDSSHFSCQNKLGPWVTTHLGVLKTLAPHQIWEFTRVTQRKALSLWLQVFLSFFFFFNKDYSSGTARWKRSTEQVIGGGSGRVARSSHHPPSMSVYSPTQMLPSSMMVLVRFHYVGQWTESLATDGWIQSLTPLSSLGFMGWGWKSQH